MNVSPPNPGLKFESSRSKYLKLPSTKASNMETRSQLYAECMLVVLLAYPSKSETCAEKKQKGESKISNTAIAMDFTIEKTFFLAIFG
jgi:hypothetical protein